MSLKLHLTLTMEVVMSIRAKIATFGVLGLPIVVLWLFGGFIGAVIAVVREDALSAALSLLIPVYGAIYTIVAIFQ